MFFDCTGLLAGLVATVITKVRFYISSIAKAFLKMGRLIFLENPFFNHVANINEYFLNHLA